MKQKFNVTGMTCTACSAHVEKAVNGVAGVESCNVNLLGSSMLVEYTDQTNAEQIIHAVEEAGYGASLPAPAPPPRGGGWGARAPPPPPGRPRRPGPPPPGPPTPWRRRPPA